MKLGVVIVTYNRLELLKQCIEHAVGQTDSFSKIVVVNNNSNDGTYEYLNSHINSEIVPIHLAENLGGSGGFSKGIEYCIGLDLDWVLLIDDDASIDHRCNGSHSNNNDLWIRYYLVRNELLMCRKHFPKWQQLLCDFKNLKAMMFTAMGQKRR